MFTVVRKNEMNFKKYFYKGVYKYRFPWEKTSDGNSSHFRRFFLLETAFPRKLEFCGIKKLRGIYGLYTTRAATKKIASRREIRSLGKPFV